MTESIKILQACWRDVQCQSRMLGSAERALRWMSLWCGLKPNHLWVHYSCPLFLSFIPPPLLLFLSEDRCFLFHLSLGFEACLMNEVLILKPLFWGKKSKPLLSWAIKHSKVCRSGTVELEGWSKITLTAKHWAVASDHLPSNFPSTFPSSQQESPSRTTGKSSFLLVLPVHGGSRPTHSSDLLPSIQIPLLPHSGC